MVQLGGESDGYMHRYDYLGMRRPKCADPFLVGDSVELFPSREYEYSTYGRLEVWLEVAGGAWGIRLRISGVT